MWCQKTRLTFDSVTERWLSCSSLFLSSVVRFVLYRIVCPNGTSYHTHTPMCYVHSKEWFVSSYAQSHSQAYHQWLSLMFMRSTHTHIEREKNTMLHSYFSESLFSPRKAPLSQKGSTLSPPHSKFPVLLHSQFLKSLTRGYFSLYVKCSS